MQGDFDLSDVQSPIDSLDDILAVAADVLAQHGETAERTPVIRLAEWVILNVGGEPHFTERVSESAEKYKAHEHAHQLVRCGGLFAVEDGDGVPHAIAVGDEAARAFAVAMLRGIESHERE